MSSESNPVAEKKSDWKLILIIVLGAAFVGLLMCTGVLAALLIPAIQAARQAAVRMQDANNMKMISIALLNYEFSYKSLPPAFTVDAEGKRLHSWRTLILPFMDEDTIYQQIDLSKPWDDPVNAAFGQIAISPYSSTGSNLPSGRTAFLAIVDPLAALTGDTATKLSDVADGISNTIYLYQADSSRSVCWMNPSDVDLDTFVKDLSVKNQTNQNGSAKFGTNCGFLDATVRFLNSETAPEMVRAMGTMAGGEIVVLP